MYTITAHAYHWRVLPNSLTDEEGDIRDTIIAWCLSRNSTTLLLRFVKYMPYCHIELPPTNVAGMPIQWSPYLGKQLFEKLCKSLGSRTTRGGEITPNHAPVKFEFSIRKTLYYYQERPSKPILTIWFKSSDAMRHCKNLLVGKAGSKQYWVGNLGKITCQVWEARVSPVKKFQMDVGCRPSQWFNVTAMKAEGNMKIAKIDEEYIARWDGLKPISPEDTKTWTSHPGIIVFDGEMYSDRHTAMPKSYVLKHSCFQLSCVYQKLGLPETRKRYLITMGEMPPIEGVEIISVGFDEEDKLLEAFMGLYEKHRPNATSGHNIFGFDWKYLEGRRNLYQIESWDRLSMLKVEGSRYHSTEWSSSGTSAVVINQVIAPGIIGLDTLLISRREFNLKSYSLQSVGMYLLGRGKHGVSPKDMFVAYEAHSRSCKLMKAIRCPDGDYHKNIDQGVVDEVLALYKKSSELWYKVGAYCVEDSELVLDILEKMNAWIGMVEMSNILGVNIYDIYTRGQQSRVFSKIMDEARKVNIVVDYHPPAKGSWGGGHVAEPIPGLYDHVCCHDFKSLYPMIMQYLNICHSTLVVDPRIPDERCNIIKVISPETGKEVARFRFIKKEEYEGLLARLERELIAERDAVRTTLRETKDKGYRIVLDKRQYGIKITCNSAFGLLGAQTGGMLPLIEGARSITATGRTDIQRCNSYLANELESKVIYNDTDSVSGNTPIALCIENGGEGVMLISDLASDYIKVGNKEVSSQHGVSIWTEDGWTEVKYVIRHKTTKKMYRVHTDAGVIEVTEDHSLLRADKTELRGADVKVGDELLHHRMPTNHTICRPCDLEPTDDPVEALERWLFLPDNYVVRYSDGKYSFVKGTPTGKVMKIESLGTITDYVYDLETKNHHFQAGVGSLIVHNSTFSVPPKIDNYIDTIDWGKKMEEVLTDLFPKPMLMELEKVGRMLCITKKKYAFWPVYMKDIKDENGNIIHKKGEFYPESKINFKGGANTRREDAEWKRNLVGKVQIMVMRRIGFREVLDVYVGEMYRLLTGGVEDKDLIMSQGVRSDSYKSDGYFMKVFSGRMIELGIDIVKGDRLQYFITTKPGRKGDKAYLLDLYYSSRDTENKLELDLLWYAEKSQNAVMQILSIAFSDELDKIEEQNELNNNMAILGVIANKGYQQVIQEYLKTYTPKQLVGAFVNHNDSRTKNMAIMARREKVSGRKVFNPVINRTPAKTLINAIKRQRTEQAALDLNGGGIARNYFLEAVKALVTPECFKRLTHTS